MQHADSVPPHITVAIPTCNRPADVHRCLASLMEVHYPRWDVLLIDQSDDSDTCATAAAFTADLSRLTYFHLDYRGASRARNHALLNAPQADIVAFLDDDCTVSDGWLQSVAEVFARYPTAAMVFGTVMAAENDWSRFYIPIYKVESEHVVQGRMGVTHATGMGASMYLQPARVHGIGRFDVLLGPGARGFRGACEDSDFAYRVLLAGEAIVHTPSIVVTHYGARAYGGGGASRMFRESFYAHGAVAMKLLRCGQLPALALIIGNLIHHLRMIKLKNLLLHRGPTNLSRIGMYLRGLGASFQFAVDRQRCLFRPFAQ